MKNNRVGQRKRNRMSVRNERHDCSSPGSSITSHHGRQDHGRVDFHLPHHADGRRRRHYHDEQHKHPQQRFLSQEHKGRRPTREAGAGTAEGMIRGFQNTGMFGEHMEHGFGDSGHERVRGHEEAEVCHPPSCQCKGLSALTFKYSTAIGMGSIAASVHMEVCENRDDVLGRCTNSQQVRILPAVLAFQPDVICLQEVDEDLYTSTFEPELETLGYAGVYCRRMGDKKDGCATFVLASRARLTQREDLMYKIQGHSSLDRDNVALLTVVEIVSPPHAGERGSKLPSPRQSGKPSGRGGSSMSSSGGDELNENFSTTAGNRAARLVIANTHLLFNPKRGDVKMAQLMMLTDGVERLSERAGADGVIICGDFNMTPASALYRYMVAGRLDVDGLSRFDLSGQSASSSRATYPWTRAANACGAMPYRTIGAKHQGGGCTIGSFRQATGSNGVNTEPQCERCSVRAPDAAFSAYAARDVTPFGPDNVPATSSGAGVVVMDPSPCSCASERFSTGAIHQEDRKTAANAPVDRIRSGGRPHLTPQVGGPDVHTRRAPPILWAEGHKIGNSRGIGPIMHSLQLRSAYAQQADAWGDGEPAFSTYHHMFKGTVDYIFYGSGSHRRSSTPCDGDDQKYGCGERLRCVGVVEPPLVTDLARFGGLPSPEEPSDHILLAVRFAVSN